jgi:hypothetical protein
MRRHSTREPILTMSHVRACQQAAQRSALWARQQLQPAHLRDPYFLAQALYKGLAGLHGEGDADSMQRLVLAWSAHPPVRGDFHPAHGLSLGAALTHHRAHLGSRLYKALLDQPLSMARVYRNAWIARDACLIGAPALAVPGLDRLQNHLHTHLGAAPNDDRRPAKVYDLGTNASVVCALLAGDQLEAALRAGEFMRQLVLQQAPDATSLVLARISDGGWLSPTEAHHAVARRLYFLQIGAPGQVYWLLGFALKAFAALHGATQKARWLDAAQRIHGWLKRCHPDHTTRITSAKLGWGSAALCAQTGEPQWAALARPVIGHIVATQTPQGDWVRPDLPTALPQPLCVRLDTAIERMLYLRDIPRDLALGGQVLA